MALCNASTLTKEDKGGKFGVKGLTTEGSLRVLVEKMGLA